MKEKSDLPVLSYSKVSSYKSCPKKYRFAYIDKIPIKDKEKPYTVFGNFCHKTLEIFEKTYLDGTELSFPKIMEQSFNDSLKLPSLDPTKNHDKKIEDIPIFSKALTKQQKDEAFVIMKEYLKSIANERKYEVVAVEKKIWLPINKEFVFYGYIDRLQKDDDGIFHIIDYKTTKDPKFLKDRTQLLLYAYAINEHEKVDYIKTSYILLKHNMRFMTETNSKEDFLSAKESFVSCYHEIQKDKLFRANASFLNCNICDYKEICEEGSKLKFRGKQSFGEETW